MSGSDDYTPEQIEANQKAARRVDLREYHEELLNYSRLSKLMSEGIY